MKPTIKKILIGLLAGGVVFCGSVMAVAATKPDTFRFERSTLIAAKPEQIQPLIADFKRWQSWSPFEKDPAMQRSFSGAASGKGAAYAWEGPQAGQGKMEILEARPEKVDIQLEFIEPMAATNLSEFTLTPEQNQTRLTWTMSGDNLFLGKVMSVFVSVDSIIGGDFEAGLAKLKQLAESKQAAGGK